MSLKVKWAVALSAPKLRGNLTVDKVTIAPAAAAAVADDPSMLEDLIAAAVSDVLRQYQQRYGASAEEQLQKSLAGSDMGSPMNMFGGMSYNLDKKFAEQKTTSTSFSHSGAQHASPSFSPLFSRTLPTRVAHYPIHLHSDRRH